MGEERRRVHAMGRKAEEKWQRNDRRNSSVSGQVWAVKLINKWGRERSYEGLRVWVCKDSLTVGYQYIPVRKNCQISSMWKRSWGLKYSRAEQNGSIKSFCRPKVKTETLQETGWHLRVWLAWSYASKPLQKAPESPKKDEWTEIDPRVPKWAQSWYSAPTLWAQWWSEWMDISVLLDLAAAELNEPWRPP